MVGCHFERNLLLLFAVLSLSLCHYVPEPDSVIRGIQSNGKHLLIRRNVDKTFKIFVYKEDPSIQMLSSTLKTLVMGRLLPDSVEYFGKTLSVRQRISPIRLQRDCKREMHKSISGILNRYCIGYCKNVTKCGMVQVPEAHLDSCRICDPRQLHCTNKTSKANGITNADFVLYISAIATEHCNASADIIAYAASCQQEQSVDRPVAGFVNFCIKQLVRNYHYSHFLAFVKHEIFHSLGFSSSLFGYYRDDDGRPLTTRLANGKPSTRWSDKVVKDIIREHWQVSKTAGSYVRHKVQMIVTPRIVKEVRDHFSCSSLEGAEIENQGGLGQRYTHLEKRVFENEAMTAVFTHNPVFSRITLALMEDTGWYIANYEMAEDLDWGRNAGCLFAMNSCKAWIDFQERNNASILPYCAEVPSKARTGCTHNYQGVGKCNMVKYKLPLPTENQYFNSLPGIGTSISQYYGGAIAVADFCPYIQEVDWTENGVFVRGSNCKHTSNNPKKNYALEMYSNNSACFLQGQAWMQKSCLRSVTAVIWGSGCYLYQCTIAGLALSISGQSYPCWPTAEIVHIEVLHKGFLHKGSVVCPPCQALCGNSCPFVDSTHFYNSTSSQKRSKDILVCSSKNIFPHLVHVAGIICLSMLVIDILHGSS